jgi:putative cell wall-binding protein
LDPQNHNLPTFCGYHTSDQTSRVASLIPYLDDAPFSDVYTDPNTGQKSGCQGLSPNFDFAQATTVLTSHEFAESATRPLAINAWYADTASGADNTAGQEIGDMCVRPGSALPNTTVYVQALWDNVSNQCVLTAPTTGPTGARVSRLFGWLRIATSVATSEAAHPNGTAKAVVLVKSLDPGWVDGIPAAGLAGAAHGPLVLEDLSCGNSVAGNEIDRVLAPGGTVYVVGGACYGNPSGHHVVQAAGANRCETSLAVAFLVNQLYSGDHSNAPLADVLLVSGDTFNGGLSPDGLSMGAVAAKNGWPIIVTPGGTNGTPTGSFNPPTNQACPDADKAFTNFASAAKNGGLTPMVHIAGGGLAVSMGVEAEVVADVCPGAVPTMPGYCVTRDAGPTRYETSAAVASRFFPAPSNFTIGTGLNWPDSVSGGVFSATVDSPMLLMDPNQTQVSSYISAHMSGTSLGYVIGGPAAVSASLDYSFSGLFP